MARPISDTHRRISAGFIGSYLGKRNQCLRDVVLWMLAGPDSTRSGLLRVHVGALADDLGHSKPAVIDALTRLHNDGHIVWDADSRTALCWFVLRNVTLPYETNRKSYLTECNVLADCPPRREAIKWIQAIEITDAKGAQSRQQSSYLSTPLSSAQQRTENREQRTESYAVAKATATPASPVVTPAIANEPQASEQGPQPTGRYQSFDPNWGQEPKPVPQPARPKPEAKGKARPTFAEAVAYFREQDSTELEACKFCDYHDAGGWKIGRNPMKDWRAAARNWMRNATQYTAPTRGKIGREPAGKDWPTVDAEAPTSAVLDFSGSGTASQPDSWAEAEALKVWRKGGKQGAAPPIGGTSADYLPWLT